MAQAQDGFASAAGPGSRVADAAPAALLAAAGWLALADRQSPIDLRHLFPDVDLRIEETSAAFSDALASSRPGLVVLMSPPAGPADMERVAGWRHGNPDACAVVMSAHHAVAVRLHALELGFDDALDLASDPMEVVGRLSIAGRRTTTGRPQPDDRIPVGIGVELDLRARAIRRDGRLIPLRPRELALLEFLARHPGRAFSREELLLEVWHEPAGHGRMVDVYVFWLRSKIELKPSDPTHLVTVRGSGYVFEPPTAG